MNIYRFTFPIENYEGNGIFEQHIYFESKSCPTHEQVVEELKRANQEEVETLKKFAEQDGRDDYRSYYMGCKSSFESYLGIIEGMDEKLPYLCGRLVQTNTFCDTRYGRQPVSVSKLFPLRVGKNK